MAFVNPWFLLAGGLLIALPILIHLINRMRFKRIRWAAMEFLLKSQKRNRRRLIIEQLILLALRCLLVFLVGALLARLVTAGEDAKDTAHLIILDDTLSMTDRWKDAGKDTNSYDAARKAARRIAEQAQLTRSIQTVSVVNLSQCEPEITYRLANEKLDDRTPGKVDEALQDREGGKTSCSALHVSPLAAFRTAERHFEQEKFPRKIVYFISDFRDRDWSGPDADKLGEAISGLTSKGIDVKLVDVGHPSRGDSRQAAPLDHGNLAITELRAESRVLPQDIPMQFTVVLANYTSSEKKNVRIIVRRNGEERSESSFTIGTLNPGVTTKTFMLAFDKPGHHMVSANIEAGAEDGGVEADNIRYATVEVRKQVPVLVIDGDGLAAADRAPGGTFFLKTAFASAKGYRVEAATPDVLEKPGLEQYPSIFLLNIPELKEKAVANLEKYVREGGGVAFFLGSKVKPGAYNRTLYKDGEGLFPAPLEQRYAEEKLEGFEKFLRLQSGQPCFFVRDEDHPMFADLYKEDREKRVNNFFPLLSIERYYPVPRARWNRTEAVAEVLTLPNRQDVRNYQPETLALLEEVRALTENDKYEKYHTALKGYCDRIRNGLASPDQYKLYQMAKDLEALLRDREVKPEGDKPGRPGMAEFWEQAAVTPLRRRLEQLRERVLYGDPLAVTKNFGKGRAVAFLTAIGGPPRDPSGRAADPEWNDWASGPGSPCFVIFTLALQKYLGGVGEAAHYTVGSPVELSLDPTRFRAREATVRYADNAKAATPVPLGKIEPVKNGQQLRLSFRDTREPGVYLIDLPVLDEKENATETRAFALNVDADAESNLKRASKEALAAGGGAGGLQAGRSQVIGDATGVIVDKQKRSDWSESPWFYLGFLVILVIEQALAVHLSFHLKGNEAQLPAAATGRAAAAA